MNTPPDEAKLYARISAELDEALRIACAKRRISKPKALTMAIEAWLAGNRPAENIAPDLGQQILDRLTGIEQAVAKMAKGSNR